GVLASVQNGKCDFASCGITITDERAEIVLFGMPILYSGNTAAVLKQNSASSSALAASGYASVQDLNGKRIGVQTGTTFDEIVLETLPDAKVSYFNSYPDMAAALEANKIDAFPGDEPVIRLMAAENDKLTVLEDRMDNFDFGIALPKTEAGKKLLAEINAWLASMKESGELTQLTQKWTDGPESEKTVTDYASFPAPNAVLTLATEGAYAPMNYYRSDEVVGLEIDMIARFCEANGYGLKVVPMLFDGILPAIQSGKADFAAAGLTITEERKESVYFSDPYYTGGTVMAILKSKAAASAQQTASAGIASLDDLANARIGVQTGTICGALVESRLPNAQVYYYNTVTDVLAALNAGKLDAGCMDEPMLRFLKIENPQIKILDELLDKSNLAAVFPKTEAGQALCAQYSEFLEKLWEDGTMKEIDAVWFGEDDGKRTVIDFASLPAANGTLRMAADLSMAPFTYMKDNKIVGYDVDVAARFCQAYGYALEIVPMDFGGILPSVQSGKCEFASSCITVTEERAESVLFSSPNYYGGIAVGVRAESALSSEPSFSGDTASAVLTEEQQTASSAVQQESFWDGIVASFNKTFIRENRWELFWNGVLTTLLITVLSILCGTALGFLVFMLCRNGNVVANGATRFSMWLVQGMPMVVLLMILYYIIFGSVAISGIFVAVIGFTLAFGAAVFGLLKMGVGAIDRGQYEAAYALGYANRRTFFRIILPQAIPHILPAYKGEIVGLIKATAIVGYIAVQDLTKMGDIVRSRTYEAFFPLIAVTVIYFVLEGLLGFLVSKIQIRMNPKKRKAETILKGVKTND
ncbi:MAG: transporter substrate-binding domain-containing protein, partial [Clostridia bacterium]|nr:transporter substrate-binding domain-containing protein [Clostridia bacterium]